MLTCREASRIIASDELRTAPWRCRLSLWFHHLLCGSCRRYARQIDTVNRSAREALCEEGECTRELKERIVRRCRGRDTTHVSADEGPSAH